MLVTFADLRPLSWLWLFNGLFCALKIGAWCVQDGVNLVLEGFYIGFPLMVNVGGGIRWSLYN